MKEWIEYMTSKFRKERNYIALRGDFMEKVR